MQTTTQRRRILLAFIASFFSLTLVASAANAIQHPSNFPATLQSNSSSSRPAPAAARWRGLIGEYGTGDDLVIVLEKDGQLFALFGFEYSPLKEISRGVFRVTSSSPRGGQLVRFTRDARGRAAMMQFGDKSFLRRNIEPETGNQLHVQPLRSVAELMKEAHAAQPPQESGEF